MAFKPVSSQVDFPALERELLEYWHKQGILEKYLAKNNSSEKKFSFLDGPKTANNPLGVHHAWGRTYKDLWQRFYNMRGYKQRFQNGYDEQGLWVEVEVEKNLGLKNKKDIENIIAGDKFASLEKFINLCKERIVKYGDVITEQSIRLGQFMDWDNSYHTSSDQNNYMIWHFLKNTHERGWLYKGHDSVPWCPRCGTAISQHEMQAEDYREITHDSIYFKLPLKNANNKEYLLVWTTTPWTIPANAAVAVNRDELYVKYPVGKEYFRVLSNAVERLVKDNVLPPLSAVITDTMPGAMLVDKEYEAPFDNIERVQKAMAGQPHKVVIGDPQILPVSAEEGTGLVHVAPGAGVEDFQLGKKYGLPVIEVIDESANYMDGLSDLSGQNAKSNPEIIINYLKSYENGKFLFMIKQYTHRYPVCWRCHSELVWRVVDEWYIAVDKEDPQKKTFRQKMLKVAKEMIWQPKFVEKRELDWLENLHDWLISKKRYWGLALPIWECTKCNNFEVVGGYDELKEKAVEGWEKFEGHSPHRPWIDQIKLKCSKCGALAARVPDVGNPWLDAGIVPYSTLTPKAGEIPSYITDKKYWNEWFPPVFAVEMYEQTRLWFYAMIAMSSTLEEKVPVQQIFGHGRVVDEKGEEMHNSKGNTMNLDECFEKAGADPMRWLYLTANPGADLRFGYTLTDEVKRKFILILWNVNKFFVDRALAEDWACELERGELGIMDKWVLARLTEVVLLVNQSLEKYDAATASRAIEEFVVSDLSTWYVRRSRDRVGPSADEKERNMVLGVLYGNLVTLSKLLAPFMPFISDEMYRNLTEDVSVHLTDYPLGDKSLLNDKLISDMKKVREIVELGHAKRKMAEIKLRQPLKQLMYASASKLDSELEKIIADELNVKEVSYARPDTEATEKLGLLVTLDTNISSELRDEGEARDLIRQIQQLRKDSDLTLKDRIEVSAPDWPKEFEEMILKATAATKITQSDDLSIRKI